VPVRGGGLIEIDEVLDDAAAGSGRVIVITGAAGAGKSALLADFGRAADARDFAVAGVRARREHRERRGATIIALAQKLEPAATGADTEAELVERLSSSTPRALLFDDAHLADEFARNVLIELAGRLEARPSVLAIALRAYQLDDAGRRWLDRLSELGSVLRVPLTPLDRRDSDHIVRSFLPRASRDFCESCAELTGGNPSLLTQLLTWIGAHRLEPVAGAAERALDPVPPRAMRESVRVQVEELGPDAAALASAIAFAAQPLELKQAAAMAGLPHERGVAAVEALLESRLVKPGYPLAFAAPVVAQCLRASASSAIAADLRRSAAELATESDLPPRVTAQQLLLAPPTGDPRVVELLIELADRELEEGNPAEALTLLERALAERIDDPETTSQLLVRVGHVNLLQGRPASTAALATGVAGLEREQDRADGLLTLGVAQLEAGSPREAARAFDRATDLLPADDPLRASAEIQSLLADLLVPENRASTIARLEAFRTSTSTDDQQLGGELLLATAWLQLCEGEPRAEVIATVRRALDRHDGDGNALGGYFDTVAATLLAFADDFTGADELANTATAAARAAGSVLAERNLQLARAISFLHSGRLEEAAKCCDELLVAEGDPTRFNRAGAAAILGRVMEERGLVEDATRVVADALDWAPNELAQLILLEDKARLCVERDALAEGLEAVHEAEHLARSLGIRNPAIVAWEPVAVICYALTGDLRRAHQLADESVEVATRFGAPRPRSMALRAKARVVGSPGDLGYLELAHDVTTSSPAALERAKVLIEYGQALHRTGRDQAARALLRHGVDLADRLGATRWSDAGLAALVAAGGRPRRARMTGVEALTPAERRVASLASSGSTNREIAEELVVTIKTVEWHLRKAFVKLGVSSREQLHRAMDSAA
jgi:DNA-binding CsgD family transcriptional regulator